MRAWLFLVKLCRFGVLETPQSRRKFDSKLAARRPAVAAHRRRHPQTATGGNVALDVLRWSRIVNNRGPAPRTVAAAKPMSAKLPPAVQQKIAARRKQGARIATIADELGLGRHSVASYCAKVDQAKSVEGAPAATLTAAEVAALRQLAALKLTPVEFANLAELSRQATWAQCADCKAQVFALASQTEALCFVCVEARKPYTPYVRPRTGAATAPKYPTR